MLQRCAVMLGVSCLLFLVAQSVSATYIVNLGAVDGSYTQGSPEAVNSSGQVTGFAYSSHTFLYTGGSTGTMNNMGSFFSGGQNAGTAINNGGQMTVTAGGSSCFYSGGLAGTKTSFPGTTTLPFAIDASGNVSGRTVVSVTVPCLYNGGSLYTMSNVYSAGGAAADFNENGQAAGYVLYTPGGASPTSANATYWTYTIDGGGITSTPNDINAMLTGAVGSGASYLFSVNSSGLAVGGYTSLYGGSVAQLTNFFVYQLGANSVTGLGALEIPQQTSLTADQGLSQVINDNGQVVGEMQVSGAWHAAIWDATDGLQDLNTVYASALSTWSNGTRRHNPDPKRGHGNQRFWGHCGIWHGLAGAYQPDLPHHAHRHARALDLAPGSHRTGRLAGWRLAETEVSGRGWLSVFDGIRPV